MGVLGEGSRWCFCSGGGRSERMKDNIFASKGLALASISVAGGGSGGGGGGAGTGFLIHRNLLLTTHARLPSAAASEAVEIQLFRGCAVGRLVPQRLVASFFTDFPHSFQDSPVSAKDIIPIT